MIRGFTMPGWSTRSFAVTASAIVTLAVAMCCGPAFADASPHVYSDRTVGHESHGLPRCSRSQLHLKLVGVYYNLPATQETWHSAATLATINGGPTCALAPMPHLGVRDGHRVWRQALVQSGGPAAGLVFPGYQTSKVDINAWGPSSYVYPKPPPSQMRRCRAATNITMVRVAVGDRDLEFHMKLPRACLSTIPTMDIYVG